VRCCESAGATHVTWRAERAPSAATARELRAFTRVVDVVQPDLVHLHSSKAGLVGRLALRGNTPTVFQPHGWSFLSGGALIRRGAFAWERQAARWTDVVVCGSHAEADLARRSGVGGDIRVVHNAVDTARFRPPTIDERLRARAELGLEEFRAYVVCVGRLHYQKGQDHLLVAWNRLTADERFERAELLLIGDGPLRPSLEAVGARSVRFVGAQDDVRTWLFAADLAVQPSRYETLSLATLEALACGLCVVATDIPGMSEAIGTAPAAGGICVAPDEPAALSAALQARLIDPKIAQNEGQLGRARVARMFSTDDHTDKIATAYRQATRDPSFW